MLTSRRNYSVFAIILVFQDKDENQVTSERIFHPRILVIILNNPTTNSFPK